VRRLDPEGFVALQRKIFVQPKKRGPKFRPNLDEVFRRRKRGESLTEIALAMDPDAYHEDPANTLQRFSNAVERRKSTHS
jgi:hypothetical protein